MNKYWLLSLCLLLTGLPFVACALPATPVPEPKTPSASNQVSSPSWEQKWANVLAEGKKEGVVTIYASTASWGTATRAALTDAFKKKFGIDLDLGTVGSGPEIAARALREKSAGLNIADVIGGGSPTLMIANLKPAGVLGDIEPFLFLLDVTDTKAWGGKLPFIGKDKKVIATVIQIQRHVMYNTDLVRKGEITSYQDLLKPQYKGKIIMGDPTIAGSANGLFAFLAESGLEKAKDFLRQLITQQDVVISRDARLQVETVAKGKYAISLAPSRVVVEEFLRTGAPIDVAIVREGTNGAATNGTIALTATSPHPNAARVFANWLLSKEGQTILAPTVGCVSLRTDVPSEGTDPRFLPQSGEKISSDMDQTEEWLIFKGDEFTKQLNEVIRQAGK